MRVLLTVYDQFVPAQLLQYDATSLQALYVESPEQLKVSVCVWVAATLVFGHRALGSLNEAQL